MTGGLRAVFGTMTKPLQAARAAANGLFAGGLAHTGFHTDPSLLDASGGFPVLYADDLSVDRPRERLDHWCIRDVVFTYHASCYGTQAPITAALHIGWLHLPSETATTMYINQQQITVTNLKK